MLKSIETLIQTKVKADIPILEITGRNGGYFDFINPNDMRYSIMKGTDDYDRNFIAMKFDIENLLTNEKNQIVGTFFNRKIGPNSSLAYGVTDTSSNIIQQIVFEIVDEVDAYYRLTERLNLFLKNESLLTFDYYKYIEDRFINNNIIEFDMIKGYGNISVKLST